MKKWMNYVLVMGLTAGTASAAWWPFGGSKNDEPAQAPAVPVAESVTPDSQPPLTPEQIEKRKARKEARDKERQSISPEQMAKKKAMQEELKQLGEAARTESDPAKKEALVQQLRAKLTQISDQGLARRQKKLEEAEKELKAQKEKLADMEQNKSARIEEKIRRILAGEPMKGPDGKRPGTEGGKQPEPPASE
jgi:hypothetical protein